MQKRPKLIYDDNDLYWQPVSIVDKDGVPGIIVNGRRPGTLFGEDSRTVSKNPSKSGNWCHGLPLHLVQATIVGSGRFYIPEDENATGYPDGVALIETGTDANGKCFITLDHNRYQSGDLSYFIYTLGTRGLTEANGDFTLMYGAFGRGTVTDGTFDQIKEGVVFGFKQVSGTLSHFFRRYKNYEPSVDEIIPYNESELRNLKILRQELGYLGIHPATINKVNFDNLTDELQHAFKFDREDTYISNPNLGLGFYVENQGNTTNIQISNGSYNYGNFSLRRFFDASARPLFDSLNIASIPSGNNNIIAAYRVPDKLTMYNSLSSGGVTTTRDFVNTVTNRLKYAKVTGIANKPIFVYSYIIPASDDNSTYTPLSPFVNAMERAIGADLNVTTLANAIVASLLIIDTTSRKDSQSYDNEDLQLRPNVVAVVAVSCAQSVTDFTYLFSSEDTF